MMHSKWFKRSIIVALFVFWAVSLVWSSERDKRNHEDMIAVFQKIDTYGPFPLISAAVENQAIGDYDVYSRNGKMTYSFFYDSTDVEGELAAYEKYLLLHGYTDVAPDAKQEEVLGAYYKTDKQDSQIKILQTDHGYELQLSGF